LTNPASAPPHDEGDILYPSAIPFLLVHLACLGAIWTGVTWTAVWLAIGLYWLRMFAIGAGYHRYFSHRTYRTGRVFQFILAVLAQSTSQKSVIWWAAKHRHHHRYSDTDLDVHSPVRRSFLYSHMGWIFDRRHDNESFDRDTVQDLLKYPELVWLHRHEQVPAIGLAVLCFLIGGWSGLVVGFFWSTVAVYHGTFMINSLAHVHGSKRYLTGDESRNNWLLALLTMGEGWHNNHHAYQYAARQGFRWWEIDPTYWLLRGLARLGVVWDLREPPVEVLRGEHMLPPRVIERSAERLAATFSVEAIAEAVRAAYAATPSLGDLKVRVAEIEARMTDRLAQVEWPSMTLPQIPTLDEVRARARQMYVQSPGLDEVAARAHALISEAVWSRLGARTA
jgi:stearoyl-CoA desaturase (delta-9 desaturase)